MKIIDTPVLTKTQIHEIAQLTDVCCLHDQILLTYPCDEAGNTDDAGDAGDIGGTCRHYLLYEEDGTLAAILAMLPLDCQTAECSAFTHPAYRRQGYFTHLLEAAMERYEDYDILFGVPESCRAAKEVLSALGAELEAREHQMELILSESVFSGDSDTGSHPIPAAHTGLALTHSVEKTSSTATWTLMEGKTPVGCCLITPVSVTCVCLHQLEISEPLRHKGYGHSFLSLLFPRLAAAGTHKIILQVSGSNPAAMALYQKTGFRITETLSFYCY